MSLLFDVLFSFLPELGLKVLDYEFYEQPSGGGNFIVYSPLIPNEDIVRRYAYLRCRVAIPMNYSSNVVKVERDEEGNPIVDLYIGELEKDAPFIVIVPKIEEITKDIGRVFCSLIYGTPSEDEDYYHVRSISIPEETAVEVSEPSTLEVILSNPHVSFEGKSIIDQLGIIKHLLPIYREVVKRWKEHVEPYLPFGYKFYGGYTSWCQLIDREYLEGLVKIIELIEKLRSLHPNILTSTIKFEPFVIALESYRTSPFLEISMNVPFPSSCTQPLWRNYLYFLPEEFEFFRPLSYFMDVFENVPISLDEISSVVKRFPYFRPYFMLLEDFLRGGVLDIPLKKVEEMLKRELSNISGREVESFPTEIRIGLIEPNEEFGTPTSYSVDLYVYRSEKEPTINKKRVLLLKPETFEKKWTLGRALLNALREVENVRDNELFIAELGYDLASPLIVSTPNILMIMPFPYFDIYIYLTPELANKAEIFEKALRSSLEKKYFKTLNEEERIKEVQLGRLKAIYLKVLD